MRRSQQVGTNISAPLISCRLGEDPALAAIGTKPPSGTLRTRAVSMARSTDSHPSNLNGALKVEHVLMNGTLDFLPWQQVGNGLQGVLHRNFSPAQGRCRRTLEADVHHATESQTRARSPKESRSFGKLLSISTESSATCSIITWYIRG